MGAPRGCHAGSMHGATRRAGRAACAALLACAGALAGCAERANEADEAARAALEFEGATHAVPTAPAIAPMPDSAGIAPAVRADAAPIGQWFVQDAGDAPVAAWGVPNSEAVLQFACDRERGEVIVRREAVGIPAGPGVITLDADGLRRGLPAVREIGALAPQLVARIPARDPLLDRARTATRLRVIAGEDVLVTSAPGAALDRVLDACRSARSPAR